MSLTLPVNLYFSPEWWDQHYHASFSRPDKPSEAALEAVYLGRLRFLFQEFGAWGVGAEHPELGPGQIATVIRHGFDLVPALLGTQLDFVNAWGFYPRFRSLNEVRMLQPVDISHTFEADWLISEKERLVHRYGGCSHCLDLGSVVNNAFRILGQDVYTEVLADPEGLVALFEVILETERHLHRFLSEQFGPQSPVPVSNCNISFLGPATYERVVLPFDIRQGRFAAEISDAPVQCTMHHCDVKADSFLQAYAKIPGLTSLQASFLSDIVAAHTTLPGVDFSAMVSPMALNGNMAEVRVNCRRAVAAGVAEFAVWNIDADTSPARIRILLDILGQIVNTEGGVLHASAMPLCWDEIEWAHRKYR